MKRYIKLLIVFMVVITISVFLSISVLAAGYYPHYYEQSPPDWGQWWWTNGSMIVWENTNWWDDTSAVALRYHWYRGSDPTLEVEGYNPGQMIDCDKLSIDSVTIYNLPYTHYEIKNGDCPGNSPTFKEQVDIHIKGSDEDFHSGVWYDHWVKYQKVGTGNGEVNFSYEVASGCPNDCWLGKIQYDHSYNATCASPSGILSGLPGCP